MMRARPVAGPERRGWLGLAAATLLGVFVALLHLTAHPVLERIEGVTLDWRFVLRGPLPPHDDVAIIAVDDRSLEMIGRPPVPRAVLAEAVDRLREAGATTVALDILLLGPESNTNGTGDTALAASLRHFGNGVLAMAVLFDDLADSSTGGDTATLALPAVTRPAEGALLPPRAKGLLLPLPELEQAARVGHVNLLQDAGGSPRAHFPVMMLNDALLPSFPLLVAASQRGVGPEAIGLSLAGALRLPGMNEITLGRQLEIPLNYLGPPGTIPTFSFADLREGNIPADRLRGRAVMIGHTATGSGDEWNTPFAAALPGVEILATAVANLLDETFLRRPAAQVLVEAAVTVGLAVLAWLLGQAPGPRLGLILNLLLLLVWLALAHAMLVYALRWLAVAGPGIGIILGSIIAVTGRMVRERRLRGEVERQRGNLARYVPPTLADALADKEAQAFDGREQMAAILFIDLQGFTSASETRSPTETAHFLKDFHAQLESVIADHRGIIAQFLGDGAFAMWGLPQPTPEDPAAALACARDMLRRLHAWRPEMTARIGVHFGPVAMAQLGGQNQLQLTAAGDTVNVASRLEAIAKEITGVLAISDDLVNAVRALGRHDLLAGLSAQAARRVRGRDQLLGYWAVRHVADLG